VAQKQVRGSVAEEGRLRKDRPLHEGKGITKLGYIWGGLQIEAIPMSERGQVRPVGGLDKRVITYCFGEGVNSRIKKTWRVGPASHDRFTTTGGGIGYYSGN